MTFFRCLMCTLLTFIPFLHSSEQQLSEEALHNEGTCVLDSYFTLAALDHLYTATQPLVKQLKKSSSPEDRSELIMKLNALAHCLAVYYEDAIPSLTYHAFAPLLPHDRYYHLRPLYFSQRGIKHYIVRLHTLKKLLQHHYTSEPNAERKAWVYLQYFTAQAKKSALQRMTLRARRLPPSSTIRRMFRPAPQNFEALPEHYSPTPSAPRPSFKDLSGQRVTPLHSF